MSDHLITIRLTEHEAAELSLLAIQSGPSGQRIPAVESARIKLRRALDHPHRDLPDDEGGRYVALEC